jgi:hypothetical protein
MRLAWSVALALVAGFGGFGLASDCTPGSTAVLVTDCSGAPVAGARIDIKVCCAANAQSSAVTEAHGLASFQSHIDNICQATVSFAGMSPTSFGSGSCTKPDKNGYSKCTVQVCKR